MADVVWMNGEFVEREAARVSAFDAGLLHGVGLFETMLATRSGVFQMHAHLERLRESARQMGLTESLRTSALAETVDLCVERSELAVDDGQARVRLTLTGGDLNMLASTAKGPTDPTIIISVTRATTYPDEMFERGVGVLVASAKANPLDPFAGHKTVNYWWRLRELQAASAKGMGEALFLQVTNHVSGGAVSNLFIVRDGTLHTPIARGEEERGGVPSPVLPGTTRAVIMELAERTGVGCGKHMLNIGDVLDADEVFLTNASWGVLPVVQVESKAIGTGSPGPMALRLREMWLEATGR
jgi:branched-chain amino acid aminotransferase